MQFAIERSLPKADVSGAIEYYKTRRDCLHKGLIDVCSQSLSLYLSLLFIVFHFLCFYLIQAGLTCPLPEGAFYLFPRVPEGMTDFRVCFSFSSICLFSCLHSPHSFVLFLSIRPLHV